MKNESYKRRRINIDEGWSFYRGCGLAECGSEGEAVSLPHTWNAIDGQDGGADYFRGSCVYKRRLQVEPEEGLRYYLEFLGANSSAWVYLGERLVAEHHGGYSTFRADITEALLCGERELSVVVDNSPSDRVYPQMADFTFYGGLYRSVYLVTVPEVHIDLDYFGGSGVKITPRLSGGETEVECEIYTTPLRSGQRVMATLFDGEGVRMESRECVLVGESGADRCGCEGADKKSGDANCDCDNKSCDCGDGCGCGDSCDCGDGCDCGERLSYKCTFKIPDARLWCGVRDPYLYSIRAELWEGEELFDGVTERFGCRTMELDPERGFILNGEEYPLRGVSRHQDFVGIGNALLPSHHKRDMELIMELGANTVRLAHYQHDKAFYDLCDEHGIVVWAEIPYISKHLDCGVENTLSQMRELIVQNYNHPSIAFWGLSNEISIGGSGEGLIENHRRLNELCHSLDKTRKTVVAAVTACKTDDPYLKIPDAVAYNHYFGWYGGECEMMGPWFDKFHREHPDIPIGVSEYGCEALDWHSSDPTQGDYTEEYQAYYHEQMIKQLLSRKYLFATYVWNMFDFGADARGEGGENGRNHKGLVTFDRAYKKDAFYAYKAYLSREPFVHIAGKRFARRAGEETVVTVYSNLPEVELFRNGERVGSRRAEDHFFRFKIKNEGESRLIARAGGLADECVIRRVEKHPEEYILREAGAVLNWFDIEAPEGRLSLNDKISDIIRVPEGARWFSSLTERLTGKVERGAGGFEFDMSSPEVREMMGGFTLLRFTSMLGMMNIKLTKGQLLKMNSELNKIKK